MARTMFYKGDRADYVAELVKKYGSRPGIGGVTRTTTKYVKSVEIVAYEELETRTISYILTAIESL